MPAVDSPDWTTNIEIQYGGTVTDAPDWVHVVSGPGGGPISGITSTISNQPQDIGAKGWSQDYRLADTASVKLTAGVVYCTMVQAVVSANVSELGMYLTTVASGLTTGECAVALYDQTFVSTSPLASCASATVISEWQSGVFHGTPGQLSISTSASYAVTAGTYYQVCFLANGTTPPTLGQSPYPTEFAFAETFLFSSKTTTGGFTSLATNAFVTALETVTPQVWAFFS